MFHNISFDISIWFVGFCASNRSPHGKPDNWGSGAAIPSPHYRVINLSIEETWTSGHPPARPHSHTFVAKRRLEPRDRGAALFLWQTGHQGVLTFLFTQEYHHPSNIGKEPGLHPVSLFDYKNLTLLIRSQMLMRWPRVMPDFRCQI